MFENYLILFVSVSYLYIFGNGSWTASMFSQSDEMSIIYPEYSKIQIWNGRTTFIYIFRPFPIPILSAFLSYYIKYMFETLILFVLFQIWITCDYNPSGAAGFKGKHPNFFLLAGKTLKTNIFPKSGKKWGKFPFFAQAITQA